MAFPELQQLVNTAVFASAGFGEAISYTPPGGVAQTLRAGSLTEPLRGIFGERPVVVEGLDLAFAPLNSSELFLAVRIADLAAGRLESEARVVVRGAEYDVRALGRPDDSGVAICTLRRVSGA